MDVALSSTSRYTWNGGVLLAEIRDTGTTLPTTIPFTLSGGRNTIIYLYGVDGITGFTLNGVAYYYRKNLQGDITHIFDETRTIVLAEYKYNAWGEHTVINHSPENIGDFNAIRYRGYYYDTETGLYYLKSRYYDPEVGRFLNMDDPSYLEPSTINGLNLYAYCLNNPVMNVDPDGRFITAWRVARTLVTISGNETLQNVVQWVEIGTMVTASVAAIIGGGFLMIVPGGQILGVALIGAGVGSISGGITNMSRGGSFSAGWVGGAVTGSISAASTMLPIPGAAFLGGWLGYVLGGAITDSIDGRDVDWNGLIRRGALAGALNRLGVVFGAIGGAFGEPTQKVFRAVAGILFDMIWELISNRLQNAGRRN